MALDRQEQAAGGQEGGDAAHRCCEVLGGVQGVGGDHHVEARLGQPLAGRVGVQVEGAVGDEVVGGEAPFGAGEEPG